MSKEEIKIYATAERTASGKVIVDVKPESFIPTYAGLTKAVRKYIDLNKLLEIDDLHDELEIGTVTYENKEGYVDSSDIKVTSITPSVKEHCSQRA